MNTCWCAVLVLFEDALESVDSLLLASIALCLHYACVKQGRVFRGTPAYVVQALRSYGGQHVNTSGIRREPYQVQHYRFGDLLYTSNNV
jgi:hypothetical protein